METLTNCTIDDLEKMKHILQNERVKFSTKRSRSADDANRNVTPSWLEERMKRLQRV
jgi:hypothetical protein